MTTLTHDDFTNFAVDFHQFISFERFLLSLSGEGVYSKQKKDAVFAEEDTAWGKIDSKARACTCKLMTHTSARMKAKRVGAEPACERE